MVTPKQRRVLKIGKGSSTPYQYEADTTSSDDDTDSKSGDTSTHNCIHNNRHKRTISTLDDTDTDTGMSICATCTLC
jgi:hypothetical protein